MKKILIFLSFITSFSLFISANNSFAETRFCASADFTKIFDDEFICKRDTVWAPHFRKGAPPVKLNREVYLLMSDQTKRVLKEIKRLEKKAGYKDQSHLFYDLLYEYRSRVYRDNKNKLPEEIEKEKKKIAEQQKLENEKKRLAESKRKKEEEEKRLAEIKRKKEEEEKRLAEIQRKKEEEENNYKLLIKQFGSECESNWKNFFTGHEIGTEAFDQCLKDKKVVFDKEKEIEKIEFEKEKEAFTKLSVEEKRAYTCAQTFGFKKGSDKFKDCVFKIYATELELQKLEVEKQLALALAETSKAKAETAKAEAEAAQAKIKAAKAEGNLKEAQLQASKAQALALQQQAAAAEQQAAASKAQANALQQQNSIALIEQGLKLLSPQPTVRNRMNTTCSFNGAFMNCW